ncbi:MAG: hypothetical protein WC247_14260 [Porticoccaceae bacterium]
MGAKNVCSGSAISWHLDVLPMPVWVIGSVMVRAVETSLSVGHDRASPFDASVAAGVMALVIDMTA